MKGESGLWVKYYDKIESRKVEWLWYPYIPYGKITIVQGDPGDGKTTFLLNLTAGLTRGQLLPFGDDERKPVTVIYQNAEDGMEDTIKPRLESVGADCSKVAYLEYDGNPITLSDDRIEQAIIKSGAKLLVFDPVQAFIGDADINRANDIRAIMSKMAAMAGRTGCAIVLVGHMNKNAGGKGLYRGLGSIDFTASARSVLLVGKIKDEPGIRAVLHIKSNLAPEGSPVAFELSEDYGFRWIDGYSITQDELLGEVSRQDDGKLAEAIEFLEMMLGHGVRLATECNEESKAAGISARTLYRAKAAIGLKSERINDKWYWALSPAHTIKK